MDIEIAFLRVEDDGGLWNLNVSTVLWWVGHLWCKWAKVRTSLDVNLILQKVPETSNNSSEQDIKPNSQHVITIQR